MEEYEITLQDVKRIVEIGKLLASTLTDMERVEWLHEGDGEVLYSQNGDRFCQHLSPSALTSVQNPLD